MAESSKSVKTSRTPEEKAARDARRAAQKAKTAAPIVSNEAGPSNSTSAPVEKQPKGVNPEDYEIDLEAPEPLSKAELRAAKKRSKKTGKGAGEIEVPDKEKLKKRKRLPEFDPLEAENQAAADNREKEEKAAREAKKQNSVWIGNLAFKTTPQSLKEWVEKGIKEAGGEEGCVTRVNLPKKPGKGGYGESKG